MPLIIEDGLGRMDANSYVTVAEARAYADSRNKAFPGTATDSIIEGCLLNAVEYLEALRDRFKGTKHSQMQALQFPRDGLFIDGFENYPEVIPLNLKYAQIRLALEVANGNDLFPTFAGGAAVKSETVGPIKTEYYQDTIYTTGGPTFAAVDALLEPLLKGSGGFGLTTRRV